VICARPPRLVSPRTTPTRLHRRRTRPSDIAPCSQPEGSEGGPGSRRLGNMAATPFVAHPARVTRVGVIDAPLPESATGQHHQEPPPLHFNSSDRPWNGSWPGRAHLLSIASERAFGPSQGHRRPIANHYARSTRVRAPCPTRSSIPAFTRTDRRPGLLAYGRQAGQCRSASAGEMFGAAWALIRWSATTSADDVARGSGGGWALGDRNRTPTRATQLVARSWPVRRPEDAFRRLMVRVVRSEVGKRTVR